MVSLLVQMLSSKSIGFLRLLGLLNCYINFSLTIFSFLLLQGFGHTILLQ